MRGYTPDEEQVREQYTQEQPPQIGSVAGKSAEFDRFIAKIKADAWDACADQIEIETSAESALTDHLKDTNPYRKDER